MFLPLLVMHLIASSVIGWQATLISFSVSCAGWKVIEWEMFLKAEIEALEKLIEKGHQCKP